MGVETMKDIFLKCQDNSHNHPDLLKKLKKSFEKKELDDFWDEFQHLLKYVLVVFKREPTVERCIDFICKFASSLNKEPEEDKENDSEIEETSGTLFLQKFFDFLLLCHSVADKAVRYRACQLIYRTLEYLGDDTEIDDDLYDRIHDCMMERMKDEVPAVRVNAVFALKRLQDPRNKDCPIIKAYSFLINHDPDTEVRKAVLSSIAPTLKTLPLVVERTRDVNDRVRSLAYLVLAEKVHIKALSIAQRLQLLQDGLNDRSACVQDACKKKLLYAWLQNVGGKMLSLLESLDVDDSADVCTSMLKTFYKSIPITDFIQSFDTLNEQMVIDYEKLTLENVFYWQTLCQHTKSLGVSYEEHLETILPDTMNFCKYIRGFVETMKDLEDLELLVEKEFILQQLLIMTKCLDVADQVQRKEVEKLLHDLLLFDHVSDRIVKNIIPRLVEIKGDHEQFVTFMAETISDIRMPVTVVDKSVSEDEERQKNVKIAGIRVKINQLREELDGCIQNQEFSKAAEIKSSITELEEEKEKLQEASQPEQEEIRNEKTDAQTVLKCLTIICEMLRELLCLKSISPTLQTMVETQIFPGIQNQEASVREMAVLALGSCCLLNRDLGQQNLPLFMEVIQVDVEYVRIAALKVIFDLLHFYGLEIVAFDDNSSQDQVNVNNNNATMSDETIDSTKPDIMENSQDDAEDDEESDSTGSQLRDSTKTISSEAATKLVAIIVKYLDSENASARKVAAEGLAKLLLSRRVLSAKILSHLLLTWYNPLTKDDAHLRACLGAFFPIFSFAASVNQELVADSFLPTLRTILDAPSSSPISEINVNNIADLLVQLTNSKLLIQSQNSTNSQKDNPGHDNIAMKVCNEFLCRPNSSNHGLWTRILNHLDISGDNTTVLKDLNTLCYQIEKVIKDKIVSKSFKRFQIKIEELMKSLNMTLPEEVNAETEEATKLDEKPTENDLEDLFPDTPSKAEKRHTRRLLSTTMSMADNSEVFEGSLLSQSMDATGKHMKDILDEINEIDEYSSATSPTTIEEEKISEASSPGSKETNVRKTNTRNVRKAASTKDVKNNEDIPEEKNVRSTRNLKRNVKKGDENSDDENVVQVDASSDASIADRKDESSDMSADKESSTRQSKRNTKKTEKICEGESDIISIAESEATETSDMKSTTSEPESVSSDKSSVPTRQSKRNTRKTKPSLVDESSSEVISQSEEYSSEMIADTESVVSNSESNTSTRQSKRNAKKTKPSSESSDKTITSVGTSETELPESSSVFSEVTDTQESATSETTLDTEEKFTSSKKKNIQKENGADGDENQRRSKRNLSTRTATSRSSRAKTTVAAESKSHQIVETPKKSPVRRTTRTQKKTETETSSSQETPTKRSLRSAKPLKSKNP